MSRPSTDRFFQACGRRDEHRSGESGIATLLDTEVGAEGEESASFQDCASSGIEPGAHSAGV